METLELKNPINFQVGRMVMFKPLQTYGRTELVAFGPWPGNLEPNDGVKWYGFGPK